MGPAAVPLILDDRLLALNAAAVLLAEELLRLPAAPAATMAVALLWGSEVTLPEAFVRRVGSRHRIELGGLLCSPTPLATLLPSRARAIQRCRATTLARRAGALARERYRELQAALLKSTPASSAGPAASLLRDTFGSGGQRWPWAEVTKRMLDRVAGLNRAALGILGLPALESFAAVIAPVAAPAFDRFALTVDRCGPRREGSLEHYSSLFAELLGLAAAAEVAS